MSEGNEHRAPALRITHAAYRRRRTLASGCVVLVGLAFGYHAVFGHNGITAYAQKRAEGRLLAQQTQRLEEENARLRDHVGHLQTDPDAIEHEARERLHYARPGEVIYTLNEKPGNEKPGTDKPGTDKPGTETPPGK